MSIIISENISSQIGLLVPGIAYLIVSKIGLINTGITLSLNITGRLTLPDRRL